MNIIVIGAGAAGMVAAIEAYDTLIENHNEEENLVTVLELKDEVCKKIYATGNGRCNITNMDMTSAHFYTDDELKVYDLIEEYNYAYIKRYFENKGLFLTNIGDYVYPRTKHAKTVVSFLYEECKKRNVQFVYNCNVKDILKSEDKFFVSAMITQNKTNEKVKFVADKVIVCTGGTASKIFGSDGSGYYLLKKLGHTIKTPLPSLVPLVAKKRAGHINITKAAGVRADVKLKAKCDDEIFFTSSGELQITDYGISGIVTFQMSGYISQYLEMNKEVYVSIDFLPEFECEEIYEYIEKFYGLKRQDKPDYETSKAICDKLINDKLGEVLADKVSDNECDVEKFVDMLKNTEVNISDTKGFDFAQVTRGGVTFKEVNAGMESKLVSGLYIAGELLNVDGICGGYNLHFAFASGMKAGRMAGR